MMGEALRLNGLTCLNVWGALKVCYFRNEVFELESSSSSREGETLL